MENGKRRFRLLERWLTFTLRVHSMIEDFFEQVGRFAARRPYALIAGCLMTGVVFISGNFTHGRTRADFELWVPKNSEALKIRNRYERLYEFTDKGERSSFVVLVTKKGGGSLLDDKTALKEAMVLYAAVADITIDREGKDERIGLLDACYRPWTAYPDLCMASSGLMAWKDAAAALDCLDLDTAPACTYALDPSLIDADFDAGGKAALLARANNADGQYTDFFGGALGPLSLTSNWGAVTRADDSSEATDVGGVSMNWVVDPTRFQSEDELENFAIAFEDTMAKLRFDTIDYAYIAPESIDREFFAASIDTSGELAIGTVLMVLFATLTLGKYHSIEGRKAVAVTGIIDTWIATGSAFGVCMWMGYIYTPFSQIVPFLALGLGVDDAFIIVAALERTDRRLPLEDRFGEALKRAGASITLTSLTDFIAFSVGSINPIPAMRFFCFHMAWAILFDLFFQCTFFVAALVIDERRILAQRVDCCCCLRAPKENGAACACLDRCESESESSEPTGDESSNLAGPVSCEKTLPALPMLSQRGKQQVQQQDQQQGEEQRDSNAPIEDPKLALETASAASVSLSSSLPPPAPEAMIPMTTTNGPVKRECHPYYSPITWFIEEVVVPLLGKKWFALAALAMGIVFLGLGINGMMRIRVDFRFEDVLLPDSFALKFLNRWFEDFAEGRTMFRVVLETSRDGALAPADGFDYQSYQAGTMDGLFDSLETLEMVESRPSADDPSWLSVYEEWLSCTPCCARQCSVCAARQTAAGLPTSSCGSCGSCTPALGWTRAASESGAFSVAAFHEHLPEALTDEAYGGSMRSSLAYDEDCSGQLATLIAQTADSTNAADVSAFAAACRPIAVEWEIPYYTASNDGWQYKSDEQRAKSLVHIRRKVERREAETKTAAVKPENAGHVVRLFPHDHDWVQLDLYILLRDLVVRSAFLVALCVMIVGGIMLIHPTLAGFMVAALTLICVDTIGAMYYWDVPLCPPSYICIVISIGLSVDYCSHIAYTFLLQPEGPTALRAADSLREIGPSVIKGGFTTWLGLCMAFTSKIRMFHYFIKPLTLGVFFGLYHGIVFIPLACYYFGPASVADMVRRSQKGVTHGGGGIGGGAPAAKLGVDGRKEGQIGGAEGIPEVAAVGGGIAVVDDKDADANFSCLSVKISPTDEGSKGSGDCGVQ